MVVFVWEINEANIGIRYFQVVLKEESPLPVFLALNLHLCLHKSCFVRSP